MKKTFLGILLIITGMFTCISASANGNSETKSIISSIYSEFSGQKGVSSVYISPTMFNLMKSLPSVEMEDEEVDFTGIIKSFDGMYILDIETSEDGVKAAGIDFFNRKAKEMISKGKFELLMETVDEEDNVRMYIERTGDMVTAFIMLSTGASEAAMVAITGNISAEELSRIINSSAMENM